MIATRQFLFAATVCALLCTTPLWSQQSRWPLPSDEHAALADAADAAAAAGRFDEAVQQWQAVLDLPEDDIDPANLPSLDTSRGQSQVRKGPDGSLTRSARQFDQETSHAATGRQPSLKTRVQERLLAAPSGALNAYEQRFGAQARALLSDALRDHDRERLSEVVRRYFGTQAGHAAAIVFAQRLADDGDALSAARLYDRLAAHPLSTPDGRSDWLLRAAACWHLAGFEETARTRLASRNGDAAHETEVDHEAEQEWPADLRNWFAVPPATDAAALSGTPTFRGNPQRNAAFSPAAPVGPVAWEYPVVDQEDFLDPARVELVLSRLQRLREQCESADGERLVVPAGVPVTAGGLAIVRGPGTIKAVSLETGKLAWPGVHIDDTFHHLLDREWGRRDEDWHGPNLDLMLTQRMYRDATFSSLSTDGRHVYALSDGGMMSSVSQSAVALPALTDHQLAPHSYNRLLVFELHGGRFVREFGGPATGAPLSGAYFLGAPLPVDDHLYCLIETQGQVQLVALDQRHHQIQWTQALYNPITNFSDPLGGLARRMAGIVPAVSGDIVVCPAGETAVVAVDRRRRTIEWTYEYQRPVSESPRQAMAIRMMIARQQRRGQLEDQLIDELLKSDHWQDCAPVIDGGLVLLSPPDSEELLCVRLIDGVEVWRRPRAERQWIATVFDANAILVGREQVEALRMSDGEPAWDAPVAIPQPGGRGFCHGQSYVLPLSTAEAASIDLATGRMIARTALPDSMKRGNLVAAEGRVVCQTPDSVVAFHTIAQLSADAQERIAARADDASALLQRGELRLHLGDESAALEDLRRAVQANPDSPARKLLVTSLIEGLRTDFDNYRAAAPEIEQLASSITEQALFHRLFAAGLQRRGEIDAAFQQYLRFADKVAGVPGLQKIDGSRQVRSDRWIAGRLQELLDAAGDDTRQRLHGELSKVVDTALTNNDSPGLATLRLVIDDAPTRWRIDRHFLEDESFPAVQAESLLWHRLHSEVPTQSAEATARLADRWLAAGRTSELLERLLADLDGPLSTVECLNGQTGAALLEQWRADPERAALIDAPDPWPTREVIADERSRTVPAHSFPVPQMGTTSELFGGWSFFTDAQGANLHAFDQLGQHAWQVSTGVSGSLRGGMGPAYIRYVATYGRFLLLVVMDQWTLYDAFATDADPILLANQPLATADATSPVLPNMPRFNQPVRNRNRPWTDPRSGVSLLGNVGPIVNGMFVYQQGTRLAAVNVVTGEDLWTHDRPDLAAGCDIIADDQTVAVWPHNSRELRLFRAVDGADVGAAKLPQDVLLPQPEGFWGTRLVTLNRGGDGKVFDVGIFDPIRQTQVWRRSLHDVVDWGVIDGRDFYFLQADGDLFVTNPDDGNERMRVALPEGESAELATVWSDPRRWYAATYRTANDNLAANETMQRQLPDVNGVVLAVGKQSGQLEWSVPVRRRQLHRDLPGKWPFVMLSSTQIAHTNDVPKRAWTLLLLEKSTGRVLLDTNVAGRTEQHGWLSDPQHHRIHLATGTINLTLEFNDPEAEKPDEPPPQ